MNAGLRYYQAIDRITDRLIVVYNRRQRELKGRASKRLRDGYCAALESVQIDIINGARDLAAADQALR